MENQFDPTKPMTPQISDQTFVEVVRETARRVDELCEHQCGEIDAHTRLDEEIIKLANMIESVAKSCAKQDENIEAVAAAIEGVAGGCIKQDEKITGLTSAVGSLAMTVRRHTDEIEGVAKGCFKQDDKIKALAGVVNIAEQSRAEESAAAIDDFETEVGKTNKIVDVCESLSTRIEKVADAIENVARGCIKQDDDIVEQQKLLEHQVTEIGHFAATMSDQARMIEMLLKHQQVLQNKLHALIAILEKTDYEKTGHLGPALLELVRTNDLEELLEIYRDAGSEGG